MHSSRYLLAAVLALFLSGSTPAQQTGVPSAPRQLTPLGQPGGPLPPARPGVPSQPTQLTPLASPSFPAPLYQNNDVARSLGLTPQQLQGLNNATAQLQATYRSRLGRLGTIKERERAAQVGELMRNYSNEWGRTAAGIFTQPQLGRYLQLELQSRGPAAFADPTVQQRLNLNAEQRQRLLSLSNQAQRQIGVLGVSPQTTPSEFGQPGVTNPTATAALYDIYRRQWQQSATDVLSPAQRAQWRTLSGENVGLVPGLPGQ